MHTDIRNSGDDLSCMAVPRKENAREASTPLSHNIPHVDFPAAAKKASGNGEPSSPLSDGEGQHSPHIFPAIFIPTPHSHWEYDGLYKHIHHSLPASWSRTLLYVYACSDMLLQHPILQTHFPLVLDICRKHCHLFYPLLYLRRFCYLSPVTS